MIFGSIRLYIYTHAHIYILNYMCINTHIHIYTHRERVKVYPGLFSILVLKSLSMFGVGSQIRLV